MTLILVDDHIVFCLQRLDCLTQLVHTFGSLHFCCKCLAQILPVGHNLRFSFSIPLCHGAGRFGSQGALTLFLFLLAIAWVLLGTVCWETILFAVLGFSVAQDSAKSTDNTTLVLVGQVASFLGRLRKFHLGRTIFGRLKEPMTMAVSSPCIILYRGWHLD